MNRRNMGLYALSIGLGLATTFLFHALSSAPLATEATIKKLPTDSPLQKIRKRHEGVLRRTKMVYSDFQRFKPSVSPEKRVELTMEIATKSIALKVAQLDQIARLNDENAQLNMENEYYDSVVADLLDMYVFYQAANHALAVGKIRAPQSTLDGNKQISVQRIRERYGKAMKRAWLFPQTPKTSSPDHVVTLVKYRNWVLGLDPQNESEAESLDVATVTYFDQLFPQDLATWADSFVQRVGDQRENQQSSPAFLIGHLIDLFR